MTLSQVFSITLQDFREPENSLDSLAKRPKYLKELIQQRKHMWQDFTNVEQGLTKLLDTADKTVSETMFIFTDFMPWFQ